MRIDGSSRLGPECRSAFGHARTSRDAVCGATRTRSWLRTSGGVQATAGADAIRALGRQLLDGREGPVRTAPDGPERRASATSVATSLATSSDFVIFKEVPHPL